MPEILRQYGYHVTAVATVNEALTQITSAKFDVLVSDLNIGHPGDGFTVVSAMRRTQPACITLILTGFPGFDTALEAIRSQVDDYLIKPAVIPALIDLIERKLKNPRPGSPGTAAATNRISEVLRENMFQISQRALAATKTDPALAALPMTDQQRTEFIARTLEDLAKMLESDNGEHEKEAIHTARIQGLRRYQNGYTIPLLVAQLRFEEQAIYEVIQEHLLSLNLSYFLFDLKRLNNRLFIQLENMQSAFLEAENRISQRA